MSNRGKQTPIQSPVPDGSIHIFLTCRQNIASGQFGNSLLHGGYSLFWLTGAAGWPFSSLQCCKSSHQ